MIGRADIEGSKSNVAMNAWLPQASYPCGNFSDTSSFKFRRSKGSLGHAFTVRIRTGNQNQMSFYPSVPHEISVLVELILGHLRYLLTDVPPQPNSPPDNVFRPDRPDQPGSIPLCCRLRMSKGRIPSFSQCRARQASVRDNNFGHKRGRYPKPNMFPHTRLRVTHGYPLAASLNGKARTDIQHAWFHRPATHVQRPPPYLGTFYIRPSIVKGQRIKVLGSTRGTNPWGPLLSLRRILRSDSERRRAPMSLDGNRGFSWPAQCWEPRGSPKRAPTPPAAPAAAARAPEDRGSKATLPLTIPCRVFKSSAKDSTRRSVGIELHGGQRGTSTTLATPTTRAFGGTRPLLLVGKQAASTCVASSPDSDLEAFSHNPAHGSFVPLAFQPSAMTNCANQRKSRHRRIKKQRRYERLAATSQLSLCSESTVRRPGKAPEGAVPSPSPGRHAATRSRRVSSSSSPPAADGFGTGTPVPSPQSQSFSRSYGSILPTSLAYIVPSTRGCSPWRPDAVMSTTGRGRHSVLRIFKGRQGRTGHRATCGALPAAGPYLRLSRFQGGQAVKQKR
ncbi:hypothetical protein AgCh_010904 [Apium graveolens]